MNEIPMKSYWMGEPVDDMPREKLIEIIHHLARDLDQSRDHHRASLDLMRAFSAARARA